MKARNLFLVIASLVLMSSCVGQKELLTYWKPDLNIEEPKLSGFDFESKLRWTTSNDTEYLYFDIGCVDAKIQQSLIRGGLTVFLDTSARKREMVFFKFPNMYQRNPRTQNTNPMDRGISPAMIEMLNMSPVFWQSGKAWSLEDPMSDSSSFKSAVRMDSSKTLSLHVAVPLKKIHPLGLDGIDKLSIGFSMQAPMRNPGMAGNRSGGQQMMSGGSGSGSRGGGGRSGGGGGGGRGGSKGGGMSSQGMSPGGSTPIAFWYMTTLAKN